MSNNNDRNIPQWFWDLLATSKCSLRNLSRKLEVLSKEQLQQYHIVFEDAKSCVNPSSWEECYPFLEDDCSEDHGDDFAAWTVMQGMKFYEHVCVHPEKIQDFLNQFDKSDSSWDEKVDRDEYQGYARADYIVSAVYEQRFNEDLHEACFTESGQLR